MTGGKNASRIACETPFQTSTCSRMSSADIPPKPRRSKQILKKWTRLYWSSRWDIHIYIYHIYIYIFIYHIYISYYYHIICSWYSCWRIILKILGWWHQGDFQIEKPTEKPSSLRFGRTGRWRWTWWSVATSMEILGEFLRVLGGPTWIGELPSGYVKIAIENGHWHSGFSH